MLTLVMIAESTAVPGFTWASSMNYSKSLYNNIKINNYNTVFIKFSIVDVSLFYQMPRVTLKL